MAKTKSNIANPFGQTENTFYKDQVDIGSSTPRKRTLLKSLGILLCVCAGFACVASIIIGYSMHSRAVDSFAEYNAAAQPLFDAAHDDKVIAKYDTLRENTRDDDLRSALLSTTMVLREMRERDSYRIAPDMTSDAVKEAVAYPYVLCDLESFTSRQEQTPLGKPCDILNKAAFSMMGNVTEYNAYKHSIFGMLTFGITGDELPDVRV